MAPPPPCHYNLAILLFLLFLFFSVRQVSTRQLPPPKQAAQPRVDTQPSSEPPFPAENSSPSSLVRTSCAHALYPSLCLHTLSSSQLPANCTPADLAFFAVSASSTSARDAISFLSRLVSATSRPPGPLKDCLEQLSDSADQLEKTAKELRQLQPETLHWQLDNALTWASAAMTNQDTCVQGIQEGGPGAVAEPASAAGGGGAASAVEPATRDAVVERVSGVSQMTSNGLYLINRLAPPKGGGR